PANPAGPVAFRASGATVLDEDVLDGPKLAYRRQRCSVGRAQDHVGTAVMAVVIDVDAGARGRLPPRRPGPSRHGEQQQPDSSGIGTGARGHGTVAARSSPL